MDTVSIRQSHPASYVRSSHHSPMKVTGWFVPSPFRRRCLEPLARFAHEVSPRPTNTLRLRILPLLAMAIACAVHHASAILTFDLRAVSLTPGAGAVIDSKHVALNPGAIGASITFELWVMVTGTDGNPTNETLTGLLGSITSGPGPTSNPGNLDVGVAGNTALGQRSNGMRGNITNSVLTRWRTTGSTSNGLNIDLDGDGDLDAGNNTLNSFTDFIVANGGAQQTGGTPGSDFNQLANGREWKISNLSFTITSMPGESCGVNFVAPRFTAVSNENIRAIYVQDGIAQVGADAHIAVATPVILTSGPQIVVEQPLGNELPNGSAVTIGGTLTFTIKNVGFGDLTGLGITVDGPDAAMFNLISSPTSPVSGPNGSTTFSVQFAPTSSGNKAAMLHIASNDTDESPFNLILMGAVPGSVETAFNPIVSGNSVLATVEQPDRKILLGGLFSAINGQARSNIVRLNPEGTLDAATFNIGTGPNDMVHSIVVQPDQKILLGGFFTSFNSQPRNFIARINANGGVESTATFNPGTGANAVVTAIALQPDARIVIAGDFTSVNGQSRGHIARLNGNGTVESTAMFNPGSGANDTVYGTVVQADGRILLVGSFTSVDGQARNRIARLNANGILEGTATFNPGTGANDAVYAVAVQPDGKILLGGSFTDVNGQACGRIARLEANGAVEGPATFNPGSGADGDIYTIALQTDGKILVGGHFATMNGQQAGHVARLNADGTLESATTFNAGTGANDFVGGLAVQADGRILLGGGFSSIDGQPHSFVARLGNTSATQTLSVPNAMRVQWLREGTAPEVGTVTFESSTNGGASWNLLGLGSRIPGGWELTGLNISGFGQVRARGRTRGGVFGGSSGFLEQIVGFDLVTQAASLTAPVTGAVTVSPLSVGFSLPEWALPGSVKLTFNDGVTPRVLTLAASQETSGAHAFSFYITNPLLSPAIASGPALPDGTYTVTLGYQDALGNPPANSTATNVRIARQPPTLTAPVSGTATVSPVSIGFNLPEPVLSGSVKLTFDDGVTVRVLTLAASQETVGAHAFSFDIANPLASPAIVSGPALLDGIYTVTLSYQDALNPLTNSAPATNVRIATTPLRLWKLVQLGNADASDLGDTESDGLVHLAEYALVRSPTIPNPPPAVSRFVYAEGSRLRMFVTRDSARNDVTIEAQAASAVAGPWTTVATSTLGAPFSGPGYVSGDDATPGVKTVEVRDTVNVTEAFSRFLRLKITH